MICDTCGTAYVPIRKRANARFCSVACKRRKHAEEGRFSAAHRRWEMRSKFGLTPERYAEMRAEQGYGCAICGRPEGGPTALAIDHDHETGQVRGLLCTQCNIGLGQFADDVDRLRAAAAYLERS